MDTITLNNDIYKTASRWNELTEMQLLRVAELMQDVTNLNEFLIKLWLEVLDFKVLKKEEEYIDNELYFYLWKKTTKTTIPCFKPEVAYYYATTIKDKSYLISITDLQFAASHLRWMFTEKYDGQDKIENTFVLQSRLTKNLIPEFTFDNQTYCGPADALTNFVFAEYIFAETYFTRYNETKDPWWLSMFFAVLYRPSKTELEINSNDFDGDKRIHFNAAQIERIAIQFSNLPIKYKNAALLFYEGSRNYIAQKFPLTFKPGEGIGTDVFKAMNKLTIIIQNETGHDVDKIRATLLYDILGMLESMEERAAARKKDK